MKPEYMKKVIFQAKQLKSQLSEYKRIIREESRGECRCVIEGDDIKACARCLAREAMDE